MRAENSDRHEPGSSGEAHALTSFFHPGDPVRATGIYEIIHGQHCETQEVVLMSGDRLPACEACGDDVRFRLLRTAPHIFSDEDFAPTA
jgi:hypothetical protein